MGEKNGGGEREKASEDMKSGREGGGTKNKWKDNGEREEEENKMGKEVRE